MKGFGDALSFQCFLRFDISIWKFLSTSNYLAYQKRRDAFYRRSGERSAKFSDQYDNLPINFWIIMYYINWYSYRYWVGNILFYYYNHGCNQRK